MGNRLRVLVDELAGEDAPRTEVRAAGRFYGQAYDIDGLTYLSGDPCEPGTFVEASVYEAGAYDIFARAEVKLD